MVLDRYNHTAMQLSGARLFVPESVPARCGLAGLHAQVALGDSHDRIPTLRDLLGMVRGRAPLLIELKTRRDRRVSALCLAVRRDLEGYAGPVAVMAIAPFLRPIRDLAEGTERVAEGDYGQRLPVVQDDDLGALSASFNRMQAGLAERQRLQLAFGSYVDPALASDPDAECKLSLTLSYTFYPQRTPQRPLAQSDAAPTGRI